MRRGKGTARRLGILTGTLLASTAALAEVSTDGTLGRRVRLTGQDVEVGADLGQTRGRNLFHSFQRFGVERGGRVTFTGPDGLDNVISRVTGGEASRIDGTLASRVGRADVWLVNPSGIVFGPGARLDVPGSFHASTADEIRFEDGALFSATDPSRSTLSIAAPESFGFLGGRSGAVMVDGSVLEVPSGEALSLVGGDLSIEGDGGAGRVQTRGGTLALAALGDQGTFAPRSGGTAGSPSGLISVTGGAVAASTPSGEARAGDVLVAGGGLLVQDGSLLASVGTGAAAAGRVDVTLTGNAAIVTGGLIGAGTLPDASGPAGAVRLRAANVLVIDGVVDASSAGGPAGTVEVVADGGVTVLSLEPPVASQPGLFTALPGLVAAGKQGGDGGSVSVSAASLELDGPTLVDSSSYPGASGLAGGASGPITLSAGRVRIANLARVRAETRAGDAAPVRVRADEVAIESGFVRTASLGAGAGAAVELGRREGGGADPRLTMSDGTVVTQAFGPGAAGSITVLADVASLDGSVVTSEVAAPAATGRGGDVTVRAREVALGDRAQIASGTSGLGPAGNTRVEAVRLTVRDSRAAGEDGGVLAGIFSSTQPGSSGNAGRLVVVADEILVDGGQIQASTLGRGDAGDVVVDARSVTLEGGGQIQSISSVPFIDGTFFLGELGDAGTVAVTATDSITIRGRSPTADKSPSGVFAAASDFFTFSRFATPPGTPDGGDVFVSAPVVRVLDGGEIGSASFTFGEAGRVTVAASDRLELERGTVSTQSVLTGGGLIELRPGRLLILSEGSSVNSRVFGGADTAAGDIAVARPDFLVLNESEIQARATAGRGGNIRIDADTIVRGQGSAIDASSEVGIDGTVDTSTPEVDLAGGLVPAPGAFLDAGSLLGEGCVARRAGGASSFTRAGRGGLPPSPDRPLASTGALRAGDVLRVASADCGMAAGG